MSRAKKIYEDSSYMESAIPNFQSIFLLNNQILHLWYSFLAVFCSCEVMLCFGDTILLLSCISCSLKLFFLTDIAILKTFKSPLFQ